MVHQHFMLIPVMTVTENIVLANEPVRAGVLLDEAAAERRVGELARAFKFAVDPHARIENITVGQQQRVEIMKALYRNADILILDEPTAVLTPQEARELFQILETLTREGIAGVDGNGQTELIDALTGLRHPTGGHVRVRGQDLSRATAREALDAGMGHIPEDRHRRGLVLDFNLAENLVLHDFGKEPFSKLGWVNPRR